VSRPVRVLMVGPDPGGRGGIVSVVRVLADAPGVRYVSTHRDGSAATRLRVWLGGSARAVVLLATGRVDVLHAHVSERGSVLRKGLLVLAASACRVPVLLHCHGAEFAPFYTGLPAAGRAAVRAVFRRAELVAALGESWRQDYLRLLGLAEDRVVVLGNPVRLPVEVPERGRSGLRVLFLGRFGRRKGSADVLTAVAGLAGPDRESIELRMAGDGEVAETRELADRLGLSATVTDWLAPAERDAALAEADVFVLPSHNEGLPMALLEAMAFGLVPVVSPVGSMAEVVLDRTNGLLVQPGDVAGIGTALAELARDRELRTRLGKAARAAAEPFAAEAYLDRLGREWARLSSASRRCRG
jgi:glycosyltransferase involved in cell wall biosynthesis